MDSYPDIPPPAYSEVDPSKQHGEIPDCLQINRKPVSTPIVQFRPVYDQLDNPRPLRHGRSVGDLRRDDLEPRINRKPVSTPVMEERPTYNQFETRPLRHGRSVGDLRNPHFDSIAPELPALPQLSVTTAQYHPNITDSQLYLSPMDADPRRPRTSHSSQFGSSSRASSAHSNVSSTFTAETPPLSSQSSTSSLQSAFREARHFVGGLIPHPTESTKHFTILRHSHGLVFYQGNSTTLAITIFADAPLPADRTLWLQNKGWSGKRGMRVKAFMGANGSWLNVTPSARIRAEQLNPSDERAWQRDISTFQKKVNHKLREHVLRETAVVRIPVEAGDGYFQFVLCLGDKKKVLCTSPVFRVFSTSATPYSIKGASLKTLPLELGALAISTYVQNTAGRVVAPVTAVTSLVKGRVEKYMPSFWVQKAASEASAVLVGAYNQRRDGPIAGDGIDLEKGPKTPYPIHFTCRSEPARGDDVEHFSTPTINLVRLPDTISQRLHGFYFGYCRVQHKDPTIMGQEWYQVVISSLLTDVSQLSRVNITEASKKNFTIRLIRDSEEEFSLNGLKLEIQVMGFIRPDEPMQRATLELGLLAGDEAASEAAVLANVNDMALTLSILDHPAWSAGAVEIGRGWEKGYPGARDAVQRQLSKVPLHRIGLRTPVDDMRGGAVSNGFYVQR